MPSHPTSTAMLRFLGRNLVPEEITRLMGCEPTTSWSRGDRISKPGEDGSVVSEIGLWAITAGDCDPEDIEGQISELIAKVSPNDEVWRSLAQRYQIEIFCGYFMYAQNHELAISPNTLMALGLKRIRLRLDIYERALEDL